MSEKDNIVKFKEILEQKTKSNRQAQIVWATVTSVDWDAKTMECKSIKDGLAYFDVPLGLGSHYLKPTTNSKVLLCIVEGNDAAAFLLHADEIDELLISDKTGFKFDLNEGLLTINGDSFGGIVKAPELKAQVDKNTELLESIKSAFNSWTPSPQDGGAALKALSSSFVSKPTADLSNIQNETVKHGG